MNSASSTRCRTSCTTSTRTSRSPNAPSSDATRRQAALRRGGPRRAGCLSQDSLRQARDFAGLHKDVFNGHGEVVSDSATSISNAPRLKRWTLSETNAVHAYVARVWLGSPERRVEGTPP
jgi:hypothetical protein